MTDLAPVDGEARPGLAPADPEPQAVERRPRVTFLLDDRWPDRFASAMLLASAFVLVITFVPPWRRYFAREWDFVSLLTVPLLPGFVYAALLLVMAVGLRRRLRAAWWLLLIWWLILPQLGRLVFLISGRATDAQTVQLIIGLVAMTAVIVLLFRVKQQFSARRVPGNLGLAVLVFLGGGAVVWVIGTLLTLRFGDTRDFGRAGYHVYDSMVGELGRFPGPDAISSPLWVRFIVGVLGAVVILAAAYLLFRPPKATHFLTAADDARVRTLLRDHGDLDSLGYFATRRDKSVIWDTGDPATARAGVSYRPIGSVSLASGNPIGDPQHWPEAIGAWRRAARDTGLSVAVMGAGEEGAAAYSASGMTAWEIGDEAIVNLREFSLNGPGMRPIRQSVTRLQRRGYTTRVVRHSELSRAEFDTLSADAASWRGDGGDERGFSMALGRLADPLDGDCVLVQAHDADGRLRGFLSFSPWGRNGLSLDLMRRDPTADNGLVELMVASLAERSAQFGVARASMNFAVFREAFERGAEIGAGPIAKAWRQALLLASRNWQLESLYRSNAKYLPSWQPRFMCFEYASDLPRVGTAAGSAEGFLTRPTLSSLLNRKESGAPAALETGTEAYADEVRALMPPEPDLLAEALSAERLPEQVRVRRAKVERLRARGIEPYPVGYPRSHMLAQVRSQAGVLAPDTRTGETVSVTGRVLLKRKLGRIGFATLRDGSGDLQVLVSRDGVGDELFDLWRRDIDLGDHIGVTGEVMTSHTGELSVRATSLQLTSKSLRPLPDKHKGLTDPEARIRARYVDLIIRPEAREIAYTRATVVRSVRDSLARRGFAEVETPILQLIHGGANARPFETHINAYDLDLYLRIATELHLKRLIVGGMEKVFEMGKQFRNEGADFKHNPEFTSLELYETYGDYDSMRILTQQIIQEAAIAVSGEPVARRREGPDGTVVEYDLSGDWPVKTICQAVSEKLGAEVTADTPRAELLRHAAAIGLDLDADSRWGFALEEIYGALCESTTTTPVFYTDFPKENAPLTRQHRRDPRLAEKWDLVIFAAEQGTAYSELVDPMDQRERLVAQSLLAAAGDPEAMQVDEDFLTALEYGMPPTGGMGMGIDRLVMNLTGLSIRDTILFPIVRPNR
ncbi:MAG TPA: bifunctional lysylphosphatidylglycerol synthetase/lysine--tRNA ligase LysX [Microlunatus sp.]|nr:bifunctional lysylphosphatidylglycerol synthetase/lysine--tRNA ligase LysX [Microlunatus sp.]